MRIALYTSFDALSPEITQKWRFPAQPNYFLSLDWFRVLYEHGMPSHTALRLYAAYDDQDAPVALLACCTQPRTGILHSLTNFYTTEYDVAPLDANISIEATLQAFATHLAQERPRWHKIELRFLTVQAAHYAELQNALAQNGFAVYPYFQYENWFVDTQGADFESYLAARPSKLRNTLTRRGRKLERTHSTALTILRTPGTELDQAVADFVRVYQESWKKPEPYPDFIPALAQTAVRSGALRLGLLSVDQEAAAAQLWINTPAKATIYKLAYAEKFKEHSVGSLLSSALFCSAIDEDHVKEIDYGVGSEPYKQDWMNNVRQRSGLAAFNTRTLRGCVGIVIAETTRFVRRAQANIARRIARAADDKNK